MSGALAPDMVLEQLESALGAQQLPVDAKQHGALLLSRLKSPVQVVVLGRPESGKSRLINMLIGEPVRSDLAGAPALEIIAGPTRRTVYLMEDGTTRQSTGPDQAVPPGTAIVRSEHPLPLLDKLCLTEVCISGNAANQTAAVEWALQRADIVLWCTQAFDAGEQRLWAGAKDALKDHSFLILTKADQLLMKDVLAERIAQLQDVVAEEFYSLFPLATIQAITARHADGTRDDTLWNSSGGKALADAVLRLVDTGRSADTDNARVFLSRYGGRGSGGADPVVPTPEPAKVHVSQQSQVSGADGIAKNQEVMDQALETLQQNADAMVNVLAQNDPESRAIILEKCLQTAESLSEIMMDIELSDPSMTGIQDDVMECTDMMVLFHLEKTEDAAADAVTLLLQLKKEMTEVAVH